MPRRFASYLLVIIQFTTLFILIATGLQRPNGLIVWALGLGGVVLGGWSVATMRLDRLSVFPDVQQGRALVTGGAYLWIRHPMYTSLLLMGGSFALNNPQGWRWGLFLLLFINQIIKLLYEESLVQAQFPEYQPYMARTKRLIPFIF